MSSEKESVRALIQDARYTEAQAAAQAWSERERGSADAWFYLGLSAFFLEQDEPAIAALSRALELDAGHDHARYRLAIARMYRGELASARAGLEQLAARATLERGPDEVSVLDALGDVCEAQRDEAGARAAWERALARGSRRGRTCARLAQLVMKTDEPRAVELWQRAVELDPRELDARYNLGQALQSRGDAAGAHAHFAEYNRLAPDDAEGIKKLIQCLNALERFAEADALKAPFLAAARRSNDPRLRALTEFCVDQFPVGGYQCMVYEAADKTVRELMNWWCARIVAGPRIVARVNLETSPMLQEQGGLFLLGMDTPVEHRTFHRAWSAPNYPEFRAAVHDAMAGRVPVASLSRREPPQAT